MRLHPMQYGFVFVLGMTTLVSGCGGGSQPITVPTSQPQSSTVLITAGTQPQTVMLPSVGGYSVTMSVPASTSSATFSITVSTSAPKLAAAIRQAMQRPLDLFQSQLFITMNAQSAASLLGTPGFSIALPNNVTTSGVNFYLAVFDPLNPSNVQQIGPALVAGSTATFSTGTSALTFQSGQNMEFALFALPNAAPTPTPGNTPTLHKFLIGTQQAPTSLIVGPDHNFWVAMPAANKLLQITTSGIVTTFASNAVPLVVGPDGAMWGAGGGGVARITTSGTTTTFPVNANPCQFPPCAVGPDTMTVGPDGNLWFGAQVGGTSHSIFAVDTSGNVVHEYDIPSTASIQGIAYFTSIVTGGDGALWFTGASGPTQVPFGRMTTAGAYTEFTPPQPAGQLIAGSDGGIWATEPFALAPPLQGGAIERSTTSGVFTQFPVGVGYAPQYIAQASDGSFWFTENIESNGAAIGTAVGHMGIDGTLLKQYLLEGLDPALTHGSPSRIVIGPDGAAWFTDTVQGTGIPTQAYLVQLQP